MGDVNEVAVVCLSGGIDSTTVLYEVLSKFPPASVMAVSLRYPSKHSLQEIHSAQMITIRTGIRHRIIDLMNTGIFAEAHTCSLISDGPSIPEGHYKEETMKSTVVPGRNLIFASIAASVAEQFKNQSGALRAKVFLGVHAGDHYIYPDCRPEFLMSLCSTVLHSSDGTVEVVAPFLTVSKIDIVKRGVELGVPFELTTTCYQGLSKPCGRCGSCVERAEAFDKNGAYDPLLPLEKQQDDSLDPTVSRLPDNG